MFKELSEEESLALAMYPLCTITNQPVSNQLVEDDLRAQMSIDDIITAKLQYGVEPHIKEMQFCTLPYDLPGEVWKTLAVGDGKYEISNKIRIRSYKTKPRVIRQQGQCGMISSRYGENKLLLTGCVHVMAYNTFGDEVIPIYPNTQKQRLINHKLKFGYQLSSVERAENLSREDMPEEKWLVVPEYNNRYFVSNMGRVKSTTRTESREPHYTTILEKILIQKVSGMYYKVILTDDDKVSTSISVHILEMNTWCPKTEEDISLGRNQIDHINADKLDNRLCNLRRVTSSENIRYARDLGRKKGSLTREQVEQLGYEYDQCGSLKYLCDKYNKTSRSILNILRNETYKDIDRYLPTLPKFSRWRKVLD